MAGKGANPELAAIDENGRYMPTPITVAVTSTISKEAQLWKKEYQPWEWHGQSGSKHDALVLNDRDTLDRLLLVE